MVYGNISGHYEGLDVKYWLEAFSAWCALYSELYSEWHEGQKQISDQKALKDGMLALLRSEIIRCYDKYMQRGLDTYLCRIHCILCLTRIRYKWERNR